jgi:hypothetical protein
MAALFAILQACTHNVFLKEVVERYGVTPKFLWRKAKEFDKKLKKRRLHWKDIRSTQWCDLRVQKATAIYAKPASFHCDAIYADECKLRIHQTVHTTVIGESGVPLFGLTSLGAHGGLPPESCGDISFFLAVHRSVGALYFELLSPTPGHHRHGHVKVISFCICWLKVYMRSRTE